jgi:hypothetical protein
MALQGSGQITLAQIASEYGGAAASAPHSLSEYYRSDSAGPVASAVGNGNVPTSGEIKIGNFYDGTKGGTAGGTKSSNSPQQNHGSQNPTTTVTYSLDAAFNPYSYGNDIQFQFGGSFLAGPWWDSPGGLPSSNENKSYSVTARVRFKYNGSVKATWGYTQIWSGTVSTPRSGTTSASLGSPSYSVSCSSAVNQIELSYYAYISPGGNIGAQTIYCQGHTNITVNPTMS